MRPDARKSLEQLRRDWESCVACRLGIQRQQYNGKLVHGEGVRRGILIVGDGPGKAEDETGRPLMDEAGGLVRRIFTGLGFSDFYLTHLVACRSCEQRLDANQQPMFRNQRGKGPPIPMMQDMPPTPKEWKECLPRLHEEIYLVDPVLIMSLGNTATEALIGKPLTITRDRGTARTITIPGAGFDAVLTDKKKEWYHKVRGEVVAPVTQAEVEYLLIPTLHPAYVLKKVADKGHDSPFRKLVEDIRKAVKVYEQYLQEVFHMTPTGASDVEWDEVDHLYREES